MIRILHIIGSTDPRSGGPIEGIRQLDVVMKKLGGHRDIVTLDYHRASHIDNFGFKVFAVGDQSSPSRSWLRPLSRYGYTPGLLPWLEAHVTDYDCVIVNGLWNYATFASARILPQSNVPYFVFTHGMLDPWFRKIVIAPCKT